MVRVILSSLIVTGAVGYAAAAEPKFTVVNKVGTEFTVVNKVEQPALPTDPSQPAPAGYQWQKVGDGPWTLVKIGAPAVAPSGTFRVPYHSGHDCPACGRQQFVVSGFNADGTHNHTCAAGHTWRH